MVLIEEAGLLQIFMYQFSGLFLIEEVMVVDVGDAEARALVEDGAIDSPATLFTSMKVGVLETVTIFDAIAIFLVGAGLD